MPLKRQLLNQVASSVTAMLIGLAFTPIMTRIFPPSAYGAFAIVNGVSTFIATALSFSIGAMLPLAESKTQFLRLLRVCVHLCALSFLASCVLSVIWLLIGRRVGAPPLALDVGSILLIPILVASVAWNRVAQGWSVARKEFSTLAISRVIYQIIAKSLALLFGAVAHASGAVMIAAEAVGNLAQFFANVRSAKLRPWIPRRVLARRRMLATLEVIGRSKTFSLFENLYNILTIGFTSLLLIVLGFNFSATEIGLIAMALTIVNLPVQVISLAIAPVVYSKLIDVFRSQPRSARLWVGKVAIGAAIGGAPLFAVLFLFGPRLFAIVFGSAWEDAGRIASLLSAAGLLFFVFTPIQCVYRITGTSQTGFLVNLAFSLVTLLTALVVPSHSDFQATTLSVAISLAIYRIALIISSILVTIRFTRRHLVPQ